jgi:hypothetical protein
MTDATKLLVTKLGAGVARKGLVLLTAYLVSRGFLQEQDVPTVVAVGAQYAPLAISLVWDWFAKQADVQVAQHAADETGQTIPQLQAAAKASAH